MPWGADQDEVIGVLLLIGMVFILPVAGMAMGAIAGRLLPRMSIGLGAILGAASVLSGLGLAVFAFWAAYEVFGVDYLPLKVSTLLWLWVPLAGLVGSIGVPVAVSLARGRRSRGG